MKRRGPAVYLLRAMVLLLHVVIGGTVSIADGFIDARGARFEYEHVEPEGSDHCPPAHDQLFCQLCRALDTPCEQPASRLRFRDGSGRTKGFVVVEGAAPAIIPLSALGPRGPPLG